MRELLSSAKIKFTERISVMDIIEEIEEEIQMDLELVQMVDDTIMVPEFEGDDNDDYRAEGYLDCEALR